ENRNTPESVNSHYNLAYTHFKTKNYGEAISAFETFLKNPAIDNQRKKDANLRLGDSYFVTSKYWPAMESYNKVIEAGGKDADYAAFQKAISYGFVDRSDTKQEELTAFEKKYPNSGYRDVALYELGNTYLAQNKNNEAIQAYDKLINNLSKSSFVPRALLKKALILNNTDQPDQALNVFKRVANDYPSSPEAMQAVSSAKLIYIDLGRVDEYASWVKTLDFVEVADAELDLATYESAENRYLQNETEKAIPLFEKYLKEFPNGINSLAANFYLGQMYYGNNEKNKARDNYEFVVSKESNEFTEQSLSRLSEIYLAERDYEKALPVLKRLEAEATFPQNIIFAQSNLMKSHYELDNYAEAVSNAEKVLLNPEIDNRVKSDAQVVIARAAMKNNQEEKTKTAYAEVRKIATGELAAESLYYDAYFKNKEGNFEASNTVVQTLAKDHSGYKKWGGKGLVIMSKNFYALEDAYQATYILESVITNFSDFPEIVNEATTELNRIKAEEAKTNASVEADSDNE
ncbi:MAG: tetratricopeptide repeat protein, partial [Flavobacteriaceae bacterium]